MGGILLCLCWLIIVWAIRTDSRTRKHTALLWVPCLWVFMVGSRPLTFWFSSGRSAGVIESNLEGNTSNVVLYSSMFLVGLIVLVRRKFDWGAFVSQNKALMLMYSYYAISPLWSAVPLSSFKRIVTDFGGLILALVVATERDPEQAAMALTGEVGHSSWSVVVAGDPYYPNVGRAYSNSGEMMATGLAEYKNSLGQTCFIVGIFLLWDLYSNWNTLKQPKNWVDRCDSIGTLLLTVFTLLFKAESATALVCFLIGAALLLGRRYLLQFERPLKLASAGFLVFVVVAIADPVIGISDTVLSALGRDASLTGRTEIWEMVMERRPEFLLGAGYRGFWSTAAGQSIAVERHSNVLLTAHNGYLETYLNGGFVGIVLLLRGDPGRTGQIPSQAF